MVQRRDKVESSARSVERAALVEPASGMAAPRQQYAPGSPTARPRQQMQVLIEQGRALQTDPNYIATARPDFFTEQYREKVVKYINEVRSWPPRATAAPLDRPSGPPGLPRGPAPRRLLPQSRSVPPRHCT